MDMHKTAWHVMIINTSPANSIRHFHIVGSELHSFLSPKQAAMNLFQIIVVLLLSITSCEGFSVSISPKFTVNQTFTFQWRGNSSDFNTTNGCVGVVLITRPDSFQCPRNKVFNGLGQGTIIDILDDGAILKPVKSYSGTGLLRPKRQGIDHKANQSHLVFLFESSPFTVETEDSAFSTLSSPATPSAGDGTSKNAPGDSRHTGTGDSGARNDTAEIVGGIAGGLALLCIGLVVFLCFRRKSRRINRKGLDIAQDYREAETEHAIRPYSGFGTNPKGEKRTRLESFYRRCFEQRATMQGHRLPEHAAQNTNTNPGDGGGHSGTGRVEELRSERNGEGMVREIIRRHGDSGWRPPAEVAHEPTILGTGVVVDVPPTYKEAS
ncbi:hypothetical protein V5O48_011396 [Marasmius crinis-equi]|uniref:Mid2 domain-containing protein n=1 Tax=Marasmius crinis-equi TaxID=585013 RepID=A0ABR3F5Y5_9AGAR